jgi:TPR repeat protein
MTEVEKAAWEAIEHEEYELAAQLLHGPADAGSAEAHYMLDYLYFTSANVDATESRQWLKRAAAQQHADELFHLSNWNDDSTSGPPDSEHRRALLLRAGEIGSLRAQRDLGCY